MLLNCDEATLGPLATLHAPVPTAGVFAPKIALPVTQIVWLLPAAAVVGKGITVAVIVDVDEEQGELEIVHIST